MSSRNHARFATYRAAGTRADWVYLMPLFRGAAALLDPHDPHFVMDAEDLISYAYGHRLLEALPLAVPWLRARSLVLVESLGSGVYGRAFLTSAGTVVKITTQRDEYRAAKKLEGLSVPNVSYVYVADVLGRVETWDYFIIERELLGETGWPPGRTIPTAAVADVRRACANYLAVTGRACDSHSENFGLNAQGAWTLMDLGPTSR